MKRSLVVVALSVAAFIASSLESRSQALIMLLFGDKLASERFIGGINAGISLTDLTSYDNSRVRFDWMFGAFMEYRISDQWYFFPEVTFKNPAGATNVSGLWTDVPRLDTILSEGKQWSALSYVSIPLSFKVRFGTSGFFAGPQIGYLVAATDNLRGVGEDGGTFEFEKLSFYRANRWDLGVVVGYEFLFNRDLGMESLRLNVRYYQGFLDVYKDDDKTTLNRGFYLVLGIPIGGPSTESSSAED